MPRLVEVVSLHESTVQAAENHKPRRRAPRPAPDIPVVVVRNTRLDKALEPATLLLVRRIMKRFGVGPDCVQVLAPDDAVVWNHPRPWPKVAK